MQILITVPRSGSHLFSQMMRFKMVVTSRKEQFEPKYLPMEKPKFFEILNYLLPEGRYWMHLPFDNDFVSFARKCEKVYLLLRDPRDIIVSHAWIVEKIPSIGLNYIVAGTKLSELSFSSRIDFLLDTIKPMFDWFENWRLMGLETFFFEEYTQDRENLLKRLSGLGFGNYADLEGWSLNKHPYHFHSGISGNWKKYFTESQKKKAIHNFGDLIESWKPRKRVKLARRI